MGIEVMGSNEVSEHAEDAGQATQNDTATQCAHTVEHR